MRKRQVLGPVFAAAMGTLFVAACLVTEGGHPYLYDGGALGACTGNVALEIPPDLCPGCASENGGKAYVQCIGSSYNSCACQLTCGYTLLNANGKVSDETARGQAATNVEPQGSCCGQVAEEMPATACYGCTGSTAYALCQNGSLQCSCSCSLPSGYTLIDAGPEEAATAMCDAGEG